jgi:hypothetical protein
MAKAVTASRAIRGPKGSRQRTFRGGPIRYRTEEVIIQQQLYVVVDTSGAGRIVGVFSTEAEAKEVMAVNPAYYRIDPLRVGDINPKCLDWIRDKARRDILRGLMKRRKS